MKVFQEYNSHIGAFLLGALFSALFFVGQLKEPEVVHLTNAKRLAGAVLFADIKTNDNLQLVRGKTFFTFEREKRSHGGTTTAEEAFMTASSTATTTEAAKPATTGESEGQLSEDASTNASDNSDVTDEASRETNSSFSIEAVIEQVATQLEALNYSESSATETDQATSTDERKLPEGVYVLANGDYVDKNGDKISGDPYLYNYQPPPEEENFTTPGGVVMDRFGNILFTPEVIDESKVLIPPTSIDPDSPPSTISPIYIPRYVIGAINRNPFLTCTQLQLYQNDRALCELYKEREADYEWIRVDEIEE